MESWSFGEPYASIVPNGGTAESWSFGEPLAELEAEAEGAIPVSDPPVSAAHRNIRTNAIYRM